jgi:hypothetical protein
MPLWTVNLVTICSRVDDFGDARAAKSLSDRFRHAFQGGMDGGSGDQEGSAIATSRYCAPENTQTFGHQKYQTDFLATFMVCLRLANAPVSILNTPSL